MKNDRRNSTWLIITLIVATSIFVYFEAKENRKYEQAFKIPSVDYWKMFAGITKERKYIEEAGGYYRIPVFSQELIDHVGKEISLTGFYLPYSKIDSVIIISRYPNSSCFFCGQAGIESVAMVELGTNANSYRMDQMLLVSGKLLLNSTDTNKLAFVITDAKVKELRL